MSIDSKIKRLESYKTSDGVLHADYLAAKKHQRTLDWNEFYDSDELIIDYDDRNVTVDSYEVRNWLDENWRNILAYFNCEPHENVVYQADTGEFVMSYPAAGCPPHSTEVEPPPVNSESSVEAIIADAPVFPPIPERVNVKYESGCSGDLGDDCQCGICTSGKYKPVPDLPTADEYDEKGKFVASDELKSARSVPKREDL